jgi:putative endonuclease
MQGGHSYILGSTTGTLYIGVTSNLYARILEHRNGTYPGFSKTYHCTRLIYAEGFPTIVQAITREQQLKGWTQAKKLALIQKQNPTFADLGEAWGWQFLGPPHSAPAESTPENLHH